MKINIITKANGVGLSADVAIIAETLRAANIDSEFYSVTGSVTRLPIADVNLFLELIRPEMLGKATRDVLIPNQEWFLRDWKPLIPKFHAIFCKSQYACDLFSALGGATKLVGFTSKDRYLPTEPKRFDKFFHLAGKSSYKGTASIIKAWKDNPDFPELTLIRDPSHVPVGTLPKNIFNVAHKLPDDMLNRFMNQCGIHLCPSSAEGFGHYIWEGKSCSSVIISTDAPPMNEFVTKDSGILIPYSSTRPAPVGRHFIVDETTISEAVRRVLRIPESEIKKLGEAARRSFCANDILFRTEFPKAVKALI